jgi:TM2 domain-containing membrane protein YozV
MQPAKGAVALKQSKHIIPRNRLYPFGMAYITKRNPWAAVWWSVALPGFGHIHIGQLFKGVVLMLWEIAFNHLGHVNHAIYHSLRGEHDIAREVLNYRFALIYPLFYVFAMYDAYRVCVELNALESLERVQKQRRYQHISISLIGISIVQRRVPYLAALWSAIIPGFGQLYLDRGLKALCMMAWYLTVIFQSNLSMAALHILRGEMAQATAVIDFQWFLFWPSIFMFGIVDAYHDCVEENNLAEAGFNHRMRKYLRNRGT